MHIRIRRAAFCEPLALFLAWLMILPARPAQAVPLEPPSTPMPIYRVEQDVAVPGFNEPAALGFTAPAASATAQTGPEPSPEPAEQEAAPLPEPAEQEAAPSTEPAEQDPVPQQIAASQQPGSASAPSPTEQTSALLPRGTLSSNCTYNGSNYIIQLICSGNQLTSGPAPSASLINAIRQFENDSIAQWLATYNLPNSGADIANFYTYMRTASRTHVRAYMLLRFLDIAVRLRSQGFVSANEQTVYSWFQQRVQARIVQADQDAVNDRNNWQNNRCTWKPDTDITAALGINYIPCVGTEVFGTAPNADYFNLAAFKRNYTNMIASLTGGLAPTLPASISRYSPRATGSSSSTPSASAIFSLQTDSTVEMEGLYGGATGGVLGAAGVATLVTMLNSSLRRKVFPNARAREFLRNKRLNKIKTPEDNVQDDADQVETETNTGESVPKSNAANVAKTLATEDVEEEVGETGAVDGAEDLLGDIAIGAAGAGIGVLVAIVIAIVTIIIQEVVAEQSLASLDSTLSSDQNNPPDIKELMINQATQVKVQDSWAEITWPDVPSTTTPPAPTSGDSVIISYPYSSPSNTSVNNITIQDWAGASVQLSTAGGFLVKHSTFTVPASVTKTGTPTTITSTDMNPTIQFVDLGGNQMWATHFGYGWVIGERFPASTDVDCPADSSGVTENVDFSTCRSYVANSVSLLDSTGNAAVIFSASRPTITPQSTTINFYTLSGTGTVTVPISGVPYPSIFIDPSTPLPPGLTLTPGTATTPTTFTMDPSALAPNLYPIILHARNAAQDTTLTLNFDITGPDIAAPPTWITPGSVGYNWTPGQPGSVTLALNSANTLTLYTNVTLPSSLKMTFSSNQVVIGGTTTAGDAITTTDTFSPWIAVCDQFSAHACAVIGTSTGAHQQLPFANLAPSTGNLSLVVNPAYPANFTTTPIVLDFPVNEQVSYTLQTHGAVTPVSFAYPNPACGNNFKGLPFWAQIVDNGNGSITVSGMAPDSHGVSSVYLVNVGIHTSGVPDPVCQTNNLQIFQNPAAQLFTTSGAVTVNGVANAVPILTSLGSAGSMSSTSPLPSGMVYRQPEGPNPFLIVGTAAPGSGGQYNILFNMNSGFATATKTFRLEVDEAPTFNVPSTIYMMAGVANQYVVQPGGFPTFKQMQMTIAGSLPSGVSYSGATELNVNTGRIVLSGTPATSTVTQSFPLMFTANNGVGNTASALTTLHILRAGDVTHDDVVDCNDVALVKASYGAKAGTAQYNGAADVNNDGVINVLDLSFVTSKLPAGTVCH